MSARQGLVWIGCYLLIHLAIRLMFSSTLQVDDAEQIRHAQHLALGYPIPQPPLYSWLSWGMFQLFGTGLLALSMLKYLLIGLTFWTLWLSTDYLFQHPQTRLIALFSLLLMPSFAWHMHQGFTHTILLGFAITTTLHALLRLEQKSSQMDYLYLGAAAGVGIMAKYSFLLFLIPLLIAAFSIQSIRKRLLQPTILFSLAAFLALTTPHLFWLSQHSQEIFPVIDQKLQVTSDNTFQTRLLSLQHFITSALAFVTPWILILGVLTFRGFSLFKAHSPTTQLLSRFYLIVLISVIGLSLFFAMPHFKVRWFHPLMMLFPLWWLAATERHEPLSPRAWKWIAWSTLSITLLIIGVRLLQVTVGPEQSHYGRLNRPITETLERLPPLPPNTVLITQDDFLGAHLLSFYPQSAIIIGQKLYQRDHASNHQQCWLLHDNDDTFFSEQWLEEREREIHTVETGKVQYTLQLSRSFGEECMSMVHSLPETTTR